MIVSGVKAQTGTVPARAWCLSAKDIPEPITTGSIPALGLHGHLVLAHGGVRPLEDILRAGIFARFIGRDADGRGDPLPGLQIEGRGASRSVHSPDGRGPVRYSR